MAKVISPAGSECTATGELLKNLLASGWTEVKAPANKKPAKEETTEQ